MWFWTDDLLQKSATGNYALWEKYFIFKLLFLHVQQCYLWEAGVRETLSVLFSMNVDFVIVLDYTRC